MIKFMGLKLPWRRYSCFIYIFCLPAFVVLWFQPIPLLVGSFTAQFPCYHFCFSNTVFHSFPPRQNILFVQKYLRCIPQLRNLPVSHSPKIVSKTCHKGSMKYSVNPNPQIYILFSKHDFIFCSCKIISIFI